MPAAAFHAALREALMSAFRCFLSPRQHIYMLLRATLIFAFFAASRRAYNIFAAPLRRHDVRHGTLPQRQQRGKMHHPKNKEQLQQIDYELTMERATVVWRESKRRPPHQAVKRTRRSIATNQRAARGAWGVRRRPTRDGGKVYDETESER
jgi:hypothetical protein